jgi:signal transduction histidine kinase
VRNTHPTSRPARRDPDEPLVREQLSRLSAVLERARLACEPPDIHRHIEEAIDAVSALEAALESGERLEGEVARRTRELSSLSAFLQTSAEREKASLARELHDELGGILTPAKMDLAWLQARLGSHDEYAERMRRLGLLIDQGIDLKRRVIERLHPSLLDHLGLPAAIQWFAEETCVSAGLDCRIEVAREFARLPGDIEIALYRLVQESLTNVVKHAKAKKVVVEASRTPEGVALSVEDDGVGIADVEAARRLSNGLAGMSHRMRAMGGRFDVTSAAGKGTRIEVFVPC